MGSCWSGFRVAFGPWHDPETTTPQATPLRFQDGGQGLLLADEYALTSGPRWVHLFLEHGLTHHIIVGARIPVGAINNSGHAVVTGEILARSTSTGYTLITSTDAESIEGHQIPQPLLIRAVRHALENGECCFLRLRIEPA